MLFNIAPSNAERVKSQLTVCKIEAPAGYTACYRITHNMLEYELWELSRPEYPLYIIKTANGKDIYFITFGEITESTISVYSAEILKNGNPNDTRTERAERYLKKYDQLACAVHGLVSSGLLEEAEELETVKIDGFILEQYKPKPGTYTWRLRTASGEVVTSGHNTPEECKRAALDKAEEYLSHPEKYPKARGNAATVSERVIEALKAVEAPTAPEEVTTEEEPTTAGKDAQRATETAKTGHAAGVESGTRNDTSAQANQPTGTAAANKAGKSITPKPRTAAGDTGTTAGAITGNTAGVISGTAADNPGHACEIAPGRTKRRKAEHVPIAAAKSPPRAKTGAGRRTIRGSPNRRKVHFSER